MTKHFLPRPTVPDQPVMASTNDRVGLYYRQSSEAQIGNVSTTLQTVDMHDELVRRGWHPDRIWLIDADAGVSGTKRIDEREGMRALYDAIVNRQIGAVACVDEDRLFRDVTMIEVNVFIEACRRASVFVITPSVTYAFHDQKQGAFYIKQFRYKCEMAADYLTSYVMGRLHRARTYLNENGRWSGGGVPVGYMVDWRKLLDDGTRNPEFRLYVPFEPYAEVVRDYFRYFLESCGSLAKTIDRIYSEKRFYPRQAAPPGYKCRYIVRFDKERGAHAIGAHGLRLMLINPVYIGHYVHKHVVVSWNNHQPIVEEAIFWEAFNYLSDTLPDGSENRQYRPIRQNARPTLEAERSVERPFLAGLIRHGEQNVNAIYDKKKPSYMYYLTDHSHPAFRRTLWRRQSKSIDDAVGFYITKKLRAIVDEDVWREGVTQAFSEYEQKREMLSARIAAADEVLNSIISNLEVLSVPTLIVSLESRYQTVSREKEKLIQQRETLQHPSSTPFTYTLEMFERVLNLWHSYSNEGRRQVAFNLIDRVELASYENRSFSWLIIYWKDNTTDTVFVPRDPNSDKHAMWIPEEIHILRTNLDAPMQTLRKLLPRHKRGGMRLMRDRIKASTISQ